MNVKKTILASLLVCMLPVTSFAKDLQIGVSMALFDDNFLTIVRNSINNEMKAENVKGQVEDAKGDVAQQLQQVQNFIGQGVDAIIVNPVDTNAVKPIVDLTTKAGIPLVFVNRKPATTLTGKMAFVGSDSELAGRLQMEALAKRMNYKGNVAILLGDLANEATRERTKGVEAIVAKYPGLKVVQKQTAKFTRNDAVDVTSNWLTAGDDIQAIASNNDEMAIGALQALGKNPNNILVAGVDGTPDALQMIKNGKMVASVFQDAKGQGEGAVQTAVKLVKGEKVQPIVDIPFQLITKENYEKFTSKNQK
ncbi:sugar ABC transporter substrate-binding protein [Erwinia aphidicola]|uniref:Sugar ABC transporter substrate-binding protein n=1 Tax=Erwinia aphidicola TaxID=68334 RepID=A0ABU8DJ66_ERWAP|nr:MULTISPECIES: sugar ABC transporter substrate-binding protein [Erwinia]KMV71269.1 rhizopine-binding protein [bacteria symbiont BFo1 of Frankliniella occidentalis]PIJ57570.1 rhizopine-binding protein [Erwinia sp. OLMDLW33]KYP84612.1 rhizopine-binding protein [bacteria symbiont BFo1 of Frankliniella occidentalis]KYP89771.1 rhizopine-binding protein [bacteria symbiont BFo1 of Frankliniella occidentalis]MBD1377278.1 sugar ABC transporter substrate-binding protein [Erwinia aphidicola]